jgi:hypothetical protein
MNTNLSTCCQAEVLIVFSDMPDFIGEDVKKQKIGTCYYICSLCGQPCNILLEELN